jgi:hypothetical protein
VPPPPLGDELADEDAGREEWNLCPSGKEEDLGVCREEEEELRGSGSPAAVVAVAWVTSWEALSRAR